MQEGKSLQQKLDRPPVPGELEEKIISNWQQQLVQSSGNRVRQRMVAVASVTLLLLTGLVLSNIYIDPAIVKAAIADIDKDSRQYVGLSLPVDYFETMERVNPPPGTMPIKMSKYCVLDGNKTTHLQISGKKQGAVHLFMYEGELSVRFWQTQKGKIGEMPWRIIKPRAGLSVLVLQTPDMNPDSVNRLLKTMFYA